MKVLIVLPPSWQGRLLRQLDNRTLIAAQVDGAEDRLVMPVAEGRDQQATAQRVRRKRHGGRFGAEIERGR